VVRREKEKMKRGESARRSLAVVNTIRVEIAAKIMYMMQVMMAKNNGLRLMSLRGVNPSLQGEKGMLLDIPAFKKRCV
jgi:hypothetical protein